MILILQMRKLNKQNNLLKVTQQQSRRAGTLYLGPSDSTTCTVPALCLQRLCQNEEEENLIGKSFSVLQSSFLLVLSWFPAAGSPTLLLSTALPHMTQTEVIQGPASCCSTEPCLSLLCLASKFASFSFLNYGLILTESIAIKSRTVIGAQAHLQYLIYRHVLSSHIVPLLPPQTDCKTKMKTGFPQHLA